MLRLSVVISAWDRAPELERCLRSLAPQRTEIHELIVADDGSTDGTAAVAERAGCTVVRLPTHQGICTARNAGAARASGDILAFVDDDTELQPEWAATMREAFSSSDAALIGGRIMVPAPHTFAQRFQGTLEHHHDQTGRNGFLPFVCGANFAIRAEVFRALGGFDEALLASEDLDLSFRVQLAGHGIAFAPEAALFHWQRRTVRSLLRQQKHWAYGDRLAAYKYEAYPFQRIKLWQRSVPRTLIEETTCQLVTGLNGKRERLTYPALSSAVVVARQVGAAKAALELRAGRRRPAPAAWSTPAQRETASSMPERPVVLFLGSDRVVGHVVRLVSEVKMGVAVAPSGLELEALQHWDENAPEPHQLARLAQRSGWKVPHGIMAKRLEREGPRTWGEAFLTLHGINAWAVRRPRFGLLAVNGARPALAERFADLPVVALGAGDGNGAVDDRVVLRVTRDDLWRDRTTTVKRLRETLAEPSGP
jgi:GT2 family glycosyltransferase